MTKKRKTPTVDASEFRTHSTFGDVYRFPFVCLDPTPGGGNLGRIEWHVEPLRDGTRIKSLLVWTTQTRDERYIGRVFEVPCQTEALTTHRAEGNDYFTHVWHAAFCVEHKALSFSAYPADHHTALIVENMSSIGNRIYFQ